MAPRLRYVLFHHADSPPSADIVREDNVLEFQEVRVEAGQTRTLKNFTPNLVGVILRVGTQTLLKSFGVTASGEVVTKTKENVGALLSNRKKALAALAKSAANPRDTFLNSISDGLAETGLASLPIKIVDKRPKKRPAEVLDELRSDLKDLPCFTEATGDVEISRGSNIFMNAANLIYISARHKLDPERLFRAILTRLLPEKVLRTDGLSKSGKRGTVQLPENLVAAVYAYSKANSEVPFRSDVDTVLKNFIYTRKQRTYLEAASPKRTNLPPADTSPAVTPSTATPSTATPSTATSSPTLPATHICTHSTAIAVAATSSPTHSVTNLSVDLIEELHPQLGQEAPEVPASNLLGLINNSNFQPTLTPPSIVTGITEISSDEQGEMCMLTNAIPLSFSSY